MPQLNCWPAPEVCFQATGHAFQADLPQDSSEVCSVEDIFIEGAVTNPNMSWKNRIKLKLK